jgi:hypothetical protein
MTTTQLPKPLGTFKYSKQTPGTIVFKNAEGRAIYVFPKNFFGKELPKEIEVLVRVVK